MKKQIKTDREIDLKSGAAYRYLVLQFFGNLPEKDYKKALRAYIDRIDFLKKLAKAEQVNDDHFYYKIIGNLVKNARALIKLLLGEKDYVEMQENEEVLDLAEQLNELDEQPKLEDYQDYEKEVFDFVETF